MPAPPNPASDLPIEDVIEPIRAELRTGVRLVISAPPGAGKTTRVPLALLDEGWTAGRKLILVEPRRIAARAAAERMASSLGERVGQTIGLRSRLDVRVSKESRIEVVTEGVFSRMILSDPTLEGIAGVLFDEFHERSLDADEGLAFALDAQAVLREDLRIVLMSATLPADLTRAFFDGPLIESLGRAWPVETRYLGYDARGRMDEQVAAAIRKALAEEDGSVLAFLPGVAEITRAADRIGPVADNVLITPLYGALSPQDQNAAIAPAPSGMRKVVIATDIAESAITIEGVRVVIDAGFARVPRYDASLGVSRLETVRVSVANADQRRGRAGRTGPGVCYRLWREAEMRGFAASPSPEMENADLTGLALDLTRWGAKAPADLRWLNPPRDVAWRQAKQALVAGGALDKQGDLTSLGQRIGDLPLPPRLAMMMLQAADTGHAQLASEIAAVMSERDLGGRSSDLDDRLRRFRNDNGPRARAMRDLAQRWARSAGGKAAATRASSAAILAHAFPERIARSRGQAPGRFVLAGGRGAMLDETDPLARSEWLAVADMTGAGPDLRITLAAQLSEDQALASGAVETIERAEYDPGSGRVRARRTRRLGAIVLDEVQLPAPSADLVRAALMDAVRTRGLSVLRHGDALDALAARIDLLSRNLGAPWPADFRTRLVDSINDWLGPMLSAPDALEKLGGGQLADAAMTLLDWPMPRDLARLAPLRWTPPSGDTLAIDYTSEGGPTVSCKVQQVFGTAVHPTVGDGRIPLTLALLSPAMRPIAMTRDVPAFWKGGYHDMKKDMKGRYPKHAWPDDPASAQPTYRAKPRNS
ncbi:MAG: ATP-dependent helicase HrpB [Alphaproteobacteria bacterium 32-64-14]|nr:MAG: ATP-dependent helicase HrpB [Alphaproteobacteria bacterium 32-64-14]